MVAGDLLCVRMSHQHLALGVDDDDGVEVLVLHLQSLGFPFQHGHVVQATVQLPGGVGQVVACRAQELVDIRCQFARIGLVGLQLKVYQGVVLYPVGDSEGVAQGCQARQHDNADNQGS
ncbi:hypothetical protein D3C76_1494070 [compost metagenome]